MKRLSLFILLSLLSLSYLVAGDWYVCIGSFAKAENAQKLCRELSAADLSGLIYEYNNPKGGTLYRVLIDAPYKNRDDARKSISIIEKNQFIVQRNIAGLWILEAEPEKLKHVAPEPEQKIPEPEKIETPVKEVPAEEKTAEQEPTTITVSISMELEVSEESVETEKIAESYSVLIRSYREEDKAIFDCERLKAIGVDAYVVKKFDDASFFKFDLHTGEFENEAEAEKCRANLESLKIKDTKISKRSEYSESVKNYDALNSSDDVNVNVGQSDFPKIVTGCVKTCVEQLPANKNFQIVESYICDFDKARKNKFDYSSAEFPELLTDYIDDKKIDAATFTVYRDELFDREVQVFVAVSSSNQSDTVIENLFPNYHLDRDNVTLENFKIPAGTIEYVLFGDDTSYCLAGSTEDKSVTIAIKTINIDATEISQVLSDFYSGDTIAIYPQIKRTFFILPTDEFIERDFLCFSLRNVTPDYAASRKDIDWAIATIGQWNAQAYFSQEGLHIFFSLFDFNYDYCSKRVHQMFMDERNTLELNDANHLEYVHDQQGWYTETEKYKELTFCKKSYNIAIDSNINSEVTLDDLHIMADDILIW